MNLHDTERTHSRFAVPRQWQGLATSRRPMNTIKKKPTKTAKNPGANGRYCIWIVCIGDAPYLSN